MRSSKSAVTRDARAGITRYLQLYHHLARELADGRFPPGEPLLSEPELVKRHRVSRTTVRRALGRLEREGRIERRRGSGTYAREPREEPPLMLALEGLCDLQARGNGVKTLESGMAPLPRGMQGRHRAFGSHTRTVRRLRSRQGEPFRLESIYLCNGEGQTAKVERVTHEMSAVTADAEAAKQLRTMVGMPLLRLRTEFRGKGDRLLAIADSVIRCDRANVRAEMKRDGRATHWALKKD